MLSRVFTQSEGMVDFWFGMDDELDAAQILSGWVHRECEGRYCFQTTFLNECYPEYFEREADFKLIWLLRNPQSVVYSMVYNWGDFAFDELYESVGYKARPAGQTGRVSRLEKGCYSYNAKISQIFDIKPHLRDRVMVVDYDDLVARREELLPQLYDFVGLAYDPAYVEQIHSRSVNKAERLSDTKKAQINELCGEAYERCRSLIDLT